MSRMPCLRTSPRSRQSERKKLHGCDLLGPVTDQTCRDAFACFYCHWTSAGAWYSRCSCQGGQTPVCIEVTAGCPEN